MVGSAVGDALGASLWRFRPKTLTVEGLRFTGRWTDDTHMMIGVAESLIANRGFNPEHMIRTFVRNWEREPWRGYAPGPPTIFRMVKLGIPWSEAAKRLYGGMGSFGNGAAMRVAPIGLLYHDDEETLRRVAYQSAKLTHAHELGMEGAAVQACAVALAVRSRPGSLDPRDFLERVANFARKEVYRRKLREAECLLEVDDRRVVARRLGNSVEAFNSVPTAIYCFARNLQSYVEAVLYAVSLGGDMDTIGAMAGAIAGAYHGLEAIPHPWVERLERAGYIQTLARRLFRVKFPS